MNNLAPVVLVAYNRYELFCETFDNLAKNELASFTQVFVFIDGPQCEYDAIQARKISEYAKSSHHHFKDVEVSMRVSNVGLEKNITGAVSSICELYGSVIVLEDDIVTSPAFLSYMNHNLQYYINEPDIWHISGYSVINDVTRPNEMYLWRVMNCWGWATWQDRWQHYHKDVDAVLELFSQSDIDRFNLDGAADFWQQIMDNYHGKRSTWAVFWYTTIFQKNGLCLNPYFSYIQNVGFDGSGVNCKKNPKLLKRQELNKCTQLMYASIIEENVEAVRQIKEFYQSSNNALSARAKKLVKRWFVDQIIEWGKYK